MAELSKETFVCVDCETTGLDPKRDRIIEVAIARFNFADIVDQLETLIDPQISIPQTSIAIHHITQEMVSGAPTIAEVLPTVLEFIGDATVIGHGVKFDLEILHHESLRCAIPSTLLANQQIDTLRLARLYGESPVNSLESLRQHFNISEEGAHRAMSDVIVNISVFKQLARSFKTKEQLLAALSKPIVMKIMPLGKHKGRPLKEIPVEYLHWAVRMDFDQDLLFSLKLELNRRKSGNHFAKACNPFSALEVSHDQNAERS